MAKRDARPTQKRCFVISPIGSVDSEDRKRADKVLKHVISPVVEAAGYTTKRADEIDDSGLITRQVIDRIMRDELVVADLTDLNPNVFYELALRHALKKPFIQIAEDGQELPFDVRGLRTIYLNHRDLDSVFEAKKALQNAISAIEEGRPIETPMTLAWSLDQLLASSKPEETGIAQILTKVDRIERLVDRNQDKPGSPQQGFRPGDFKALRDLVERLSKEERLSHEDHAELLKYGDTSSAFDSWVFSLSSVPRGPGQDFKDTKGS